MSGNRQFQTTALKKGQVVKVRTRYAITFDGNVTETAWEKVLWKTISFLPLSPNASNGYINSIKISQQKISWFWYCRKNRE
jgi:hypothetical protein